MKKVFILLSMFAILLAGCSNGDELPVGEGTFSYEGVAYELKTGVIHTEPPTHMAIIEGEVIMKYAHTLSFYGSNRNQVIVKFFSTSSELLSGEYHLVSTNIHTQGKNVEAHISVTDSEVPEYQSIVLPEVSRVSLNLAKNNNVYTVTLSSAMIQLNWAGSLQ